MKAKKNVYMVVQAKNVLLAINLDHIICIIDEQWIIPTSILKKGIYGILNNNGQLVPIFDFGYKFGFGATSKSSANRILLVNACFNDKDLNFGILVSDIYKILNENDLKKNNELHEVNPSQYQLIKEIDCKKFINQSDLKIIYDYYNLNNKK